MNKQLHCIRDWSGKREAWVRDGEQDKIFSMKAGVSYMHVYMYMYVINLPTQFRGAMSLIESLDRMSINRKYLKYKPSVGLKEDRRAWWNYAIQAVLVEDVQRRSQMWSWKHIREHR